MQRNAFSEQQPLLIHPWQSHQPRSLVVELGNSCVCLAVLCGRKKNGDSGSLSDWLTLEK